MSGTVQDIIGFTLAPFWYPLVRGRFGGGGDSQAPTLAGMQIQTAAYGRPIPIIYGRQRIAGNLVWYHDLKPVATTETVGAKSVLGVSTTG